VNISIFKYIQPFSGIKRTEGKQAHQCADTFGAVLAERAVFADNNVFLQRGRYFLFHTTSIICSIMLFSASLIP
jgi:hypothetical protein